MESHVVFHPTQTKRIKIMKVMMSLEQKRALLDSAGSKIFHVTFIKADGSVREMTCKKWVERHFTYGKQQARPNTCANKPEIYTVSDIGNADAFRNVNLNKLLKAKVNGTEYIFGG
jgi:hypothetical protein